MAIVSSVSLDISGFINGLQKMQSAIQSESVLSAPMEAKISTLRKALLAGAVAFGVAVQRTYAAMVEGGNLAKLSRESGIAVSELMRLRIAMQTVGGSAEDAQSTVNKLQSAVAAAGAGSASATTDLAALGLTARDFTGLNMEGGIRKVANALRGMRDPVQQNRLSLALLGKDAEAMVDAFGAGGHIEAVGQALGSQAAVMQSSAGIFREIQKAFTQGLGFFDAIKIRVQGFFVGLASQVGPQVLQILNSFKATASGNLFNETAFGAKIGEAVALMVQAFRTGNLTELILGALKVGFLRATDYFQEQFSAAVLFFQQQLAGGDLLKGVETVFARIRAEVGFILAGFAKLPGIFEGLQGPLQTFGNILRGILKSAVGEMALELSKVVSKLDIPFLGAQAAQRLAQAGVDMKESAKGAFGEANTSAEELRRRVGELGRMYFDPSTWPTSGDIDRLIGDPLKKVLKNAWDRTTSGAQGGGAESNFPNLVAQLRAKNAEELRALQAGLTPLGGSTFAAPQGAATEAPRLSRAQQVFGMFGTLGGGTVRGTFQTFDPIVNQQKISNQLLKTIVDNTKGKAVAVTAPIYQ
jgi:hypothetical protein